MKTEFRENSIFLSVVIPCFNEENAIKEVISKVINVCRQQGYSFEVIVVDNCSTDNSADIARTTGAFVLSSSARTVAAVRNEGVSIASGELLLFLDADVVLGDAWGDRLAQIAGILITERVIAGSHCSVPSKLKGLFRDWYLSIEKSSRDTHVGSGHMLINSNLFRELGGFNEALKSGEDYDLCQRANLSGCKLWIDPKLVACHQGYPETVAGFLRRERWHGEGDTTSVKKMINSKVAVAALLFGILHLTTFVSLFLGIGETLVSLGSIFLFCTFVVIFKFRVNSPFLILKLLPAIYLYLMGRLLSFFPSNSY